MAVAARQCARWKAAALLLEHMVFVKNMEHAGSACLMAALPTHNQDLNIAADTDEANGKVEEINL